MLYGLFFLLGLSFIKNFNSAFLIPFFALFIPLAWKAPRKAAPLFCLFLLANLYGQVKKECPPTLNAVQGIAYFIPREIKEHRSHFKKMEFLQGTIRSMQTDSGQRIKNIPCSIPLSSAIKRPPINSSYYIQGSLERKGDDGYFSFNPNLFIPWEPVPYSFSLTEWRFNTKKLLSQKIHSLFSDSNVADVMTALTIGTLDNRMLKFDFGKLGLQHILAISGFHFGLLAFFLGLFFKTIFKEKIAYTALLLSLTLYFLLLGNSPSILRAYLALSLYLISKLGHSKSSGINILGTSLFLELLIDPQVISHLGFQLSFLATFSILFLLPLTKKWTLMFFPYRTVNQALQLHVIERWTYLFCCFLRSSFALNIAVSLTTIPVCLFYFHKFPLMSLAYNLFIPLAFSLSLFLFFASLPFFLLFPPFASFLTYCNELFTAEILSLISQSPLCFDIFLRTPQFPLSLLLILLLSIFSLPLTAFHRSIVK